MFFCNVAVVAAEAEQNSANFLASRGNTRRQNFREFPGIAECNCGAIQRTSVLAPQSIAAGIGGALLAGAKSTAVRLVTTRATAAVIVVGAQYVNRGRPSLAHREPSDCQYKHYN